MNGNFLEDKREKGYGSPPALAAALCAFHVGPRSLQWGCLLPHRLPNKMLRLKKKGKSHRLGVINPWHRACHSLSAMSWGGISP